MRQAAVSIQLAYHFLFLNGGKHYQRTPSWISPVRRSLRLTPSGTFLALGLARRFSLTEPGHAAILKSVVRTNLSLGGY